MLHAAQRSEMISSKTHCSLTRCPTAVADLGGEGGGGGGGGGGAWRAHAPPLTYG